MNQGRIIVITGSPGTGKTTTASIVAKESNMDKSVHMHTDDFFHYLSKGAIPPHLPESNEQNLVVIEAFLEAAKRYARGGYDVIVDGIVGPTCLLYHIQTLMSTHFILFFIFYFPALLRNSSALTPNGFSPQRYHMPVMQTTEGTPSGRISSDIQPSGITGRARPAAIGRSS